MFDAFVKRLKKERLSQEFLEIGYFKRLTLEELHTLLNYKSSKFKKYIGLIGTLQKKNFLIMREEEEKTKKIFSMIFDNENSKNTKELIELLLKTNLLLSNSSVAFSYTFLSLNEKYKVKALSRLVFESHFIEKMNLSKIAIAISKTKNKEQAEILADLFSMEFLYHQKCFSKIVYLILDHPNCKYLDSLVDVLNNPDLFRTEQPLQLIGYFLKAKNALEADLIYETLSNTFMLRSGLLFGVLDVIIDKRYEGYLPYLEELINNKDLLTDEKFKQIFNDMLSSGNEMHLEGIVSLLSFRSIINNNYKLALLTSRIFQSTKKFQVDALLLLAKENRLLDSIYTELLLNSIVKAKKSYQVDCLIQSSDELIKANDREEIIKIILLTNNPVICKYISFFLKKQELFTMKKSVSKEDPTKTSYQLLRYTFLDLFHVLLLLKYEYQMQTFMNILTIPDILDYKVLFIFDYLKKANTYQCEAILMLMLDTEIYKEEKQARLIRYLFIYQDKKHVELIAKIIYNLESIGYLKAIELIDLVTSPKNNIDILAEVITEKLDRGDYVFDLELDKIRNLAIQEELTKLKKLKVSNIK